MALIVEPVHLSYRDAKGWIGRLTFYVSGDTGSNTLDDFNSCAATLKTAVDGLTNAIIQSTGGLPSPAIYTLQYGTNAEYPAEWMKCVMTFSTAQNEIHRFKIPAPKIAIMESDGITVINDGTSSPVVAFVNAVKNADPSGTFVSTKSGEAYTHFEGGIVRLGRQPRRFNERVKSSHLVAGEGE